MRVLGRRLAAGFCAVVLAVALAAYPLRARAMASATLAAVGGATVIAATLAACGIYPYASAGEGSFGEWGARALTDLLEKYNQAHIESTIRMEQVRAYVVGRTLAIGREVWDKLRDFAAWVRDTYVLADNQAGVNIGVTSPGLNTSILSALELATVSGYDYSGWYDTIANYSYPLKNGGYDLVRVYVRVFCEHGVYYDGQSPFTVDLFYLGGKSKSFASWGKGRNSVMTLTPPYPYKVYDSNDTSHALQDLTFSGDYVSYCFDYGGASDVFSGITADTTTVSVPAALPVEDDSEFVGLSVYPGTVSGVDTPATAMTPEAVEDIIQQGVMSRERPIVRPVEVEVEAGTTVDTETGEVITGEAAEPIVISPTTIPLSVSDYAIPGLSSLFPFSVPWDIARVWQALDAEPRWPLEDVVFAWDIPELWGSEPLTVRFRLEDMPQQVQDSIQGLARTVRAFLLLIACIGFLIFAVGFIKF